MHEFRRSALESIWDEMYPNQLEAIDFLYKLAVLIEDGKKFIHAGRGFKIEEV